MLKTILDRIIAIRTWLKTNNYDAIIVPHEDEYLSECLPTHNERLRWLTNFTGSAGVAIITYDKAVIFVDGRYIIQAIKEVSCKLFKVHYLIQEAEAEANWLLQNLSKNSKITFDPRMHNILWMDSIRNKLANTYKLIHLINNPIDELWKERPKIILSNILLMSIKLTGKSSKNKRNKIAQAIKKLNADSLIITSLDSICWLLNIRALDIPRLPVLLSQVILHNNGNVELFLNPRKIPKNFKKHVGDGVTIYHYKLLEKHLKMLSGKRIIIDPEKSNAWFKIILQKVNTKIIKKPDPCLIEKSIKNKSEITGIKACHIRDGVAMVKFLSWLDFEISSGNFHDEEILAKKLLSIREMDPSLKDLSFNTISATGSNSSICHYNYKNNIRPKKLRNNTLYLIDSGGQYLDGTTDITRTISIGNPTKKMINQFTLVLKGHIGIATARFPKGTCGYQIDVLARQHLWREGYDYDHSTGHGVGHFLNVHEGPQKISKTANNVALCKGMVISNEPGYYCPSFGIRIENLELIIEIKTKGDFSILAFESLTLCPIDKKNININLLSQKEKKWLNKYHKKVWKKISPLVTGKTKKWLKKATSCIH
ncbi:aminopeptidase P family protein [Candidatus Photodesmus anomalopis]|uniref:Creatinase/prolidase n=1 Tax=Candidatus Photodesmus katoptron Akat1 TaxID=1236703 RepID=S3E1H2_9GAMM|nr:aminopeptidase P family protein [Candidatus Photodesmus katoptron]EPE38026.1 creatinase/prolidase [Candidatus Photodesmus katoptron Akat1]